MISAFLLGLLLQDGLSVDDFRKLHRDLQPPTGEAWRTIPWKLTLLNARDQAARESKPVFLWAMDGHPLGCT